MAITEEQRKERRKFLGSSDIAALFTDNDGRSLDPFKTATDVWALKAFDHEPSEATAAMDRGNRYEPVLIKYAEQELGVEIETEPSKLRFICKDHPIFACNLDGYIKPFEAIVEAKTTGMTSEWGDPGTDDVPHRVALQVHQQMLCTGLDKAYIVVLLGNYGLREEIYEVERNETIIKAIIERGEQFWRDNVLTRERPINAGAGSIRTFKRIVREPASWGEIDAEDVKDWEYHKEQSRYHKNEAEELQARILAQLKDNEGAKLPDNMEFTYFQQSRKSIDTKKLKQEYPDTYESVSKTSNYRVARVRKAR